MSFLEYAGKVKKVGYEYHFSMKNKNNSIKSCFRIDVPNPVYDAPFKKVFSYNKKILENMLNSLIFNGIYRIKILSYLTNEYFPESGAKFGKSSKKLDICVECEFERKENFILIEGEDNQNKEGKKIIIGIEMQIGFTECNYQRFVKYGAYLYSIKKVDEVYIIALTINFNKGKPRKNRSNKTSFLKDSLPNHTKIKKLDYLTIIQIDLNYVYHLLKEDKEIVILNKNYEIKKSGKEWIKYLTIPVWCDSYDENYYTIPDYSANNFIYEKNVKDAFNIIHKYDRNEYEEYLESINKDKIIEDLKAENAELKNKLYKNKGKKNISKKKIFYPKDEPEYEEEEEEGEIDDEQSEEREDDSSNDNQGNDGDGNNNIYIKEKMDLD